MSNAVLQDAHKTSQLLLEGRFLAELAELAELSIEQFDHWTNPSGLRMGVTGWSRTEGCEDAA